MGVDQVFIAGLDDLDNINLAMLAVRSMTSRSDDLPPLVLAVRIDREDLAIELDAALDGLARHHRIRYHRICPDRDGLRIELAQYAPVFAKPDRTKPSHVLIVGLKGRWEQALAQTVVALQDHPTQRPIVTLVLASDERAAFDYWRAAHPDLDLVVQFGFLNDLARATPGDKDVANSVDAHGAPNLTIVLLDGTDAIAAALALRRPTNPLGALSSPILVRQTKEDFLLAALAETDVKDRDHSRLVPFSGPIRAESVARVLDRKGDEIAMALHAYYLDTTRRIPPGSPAAIAEWDELPENLREANRAAAGHMAILFASEGLRLADAAAIRRAVDDPVVLDRLARVEHRRWLADRIERGWRYGATRDNARLLHPSILEFDALSQDDQEKDRAAVRAFAKILA